VIIVFEGHDLSGKTTAATLLGQEFDIPVIKPWADLSAARSSLTSISRTLLSVVRGVRADFIFDRFITSEYIYGPTSGRETTYLDELLEEWRDVSEFCLVELRIGEKELRARFTERGDHMFDIQTILALRERYRVLRSLVPSWMDYTACDGVACARSAISRRLSVS
jgi:hypothetical protein